MSHSWSGRLLVWLSLSLAYAGCVPGQIKILHEPRFTSFSRSTPPTRAHYPPGEWGLPAPPLVSGYDYMLLFSPEEMQPGAVVIQHVAVSGVQRDTRASCGDTPVPFGFTFQEYFPAPAHDVHAWLQLRPELSYFEARRAIVAYAPLPGTPPVIGPGRNSAFLGPDYLATLTDAERAGLNPGRLDQASFVRWEHQYQYDGCNGVTNAATGCGQTHCLSFTWHVIEGGRRGRDRTEQFAEAGGTW